MIRINLAKTSKASKTSADASPEMSINAADVAVLRKTALIRLVIILLGPVALLTYEQQTIPSLQASVAQKTKELSTLTEKNQKAAEAVEQTKKFKKEQEVLQAQINTIEGLKKDRLREVRLLDFVQKDLPPHLWLSRMELHDGKLNVQGFSTTDSELTQFMDGLSRSAYLKEVSLIRSTDEATPTMGNLKKFEVSCLIDTVEKATL